MLNRKTKYFFCNSRDTLFSTRVPEPTGNWSEPLEAVKFGTKCYSYCYENNLPGDREIVGEDCLTLDIYRPIQASYYQTNYPIMVWIHGGGFATGNSAMYDAGRIVDKGFIVVLIQSELKSIILGKLRMPAVFIILPIKNEFLMRN